MKKKRKKTTKNLSAELSGSGDLPLNQFHADPLVDGDCTEFSKIRIFTVGNQTIQYTFREHYLYFPWENKKSRFFSNLCPPAAYHLEKRSDLKHFNFFDFIKNKKSIKLYRFAIENKLCDDLLEYISDEIESQAILIFRQKLEELRSSKLLNEVDRSKPTDIPFVPPIIDKSDCHFLSIRKVPTDDDLKRTQIPDPNLQKFLDWFNNLDDPLIDEITVDQPFSKITLKSSICDIEYDQHGILSDKSRMFRFGSISEARCIRRIVRYLIQDYHRRFNTKFKFVLAGSPGSGKTYVKHLFSGYNITDLDDISMLDPNESNRFHSLIEKRNWKQMKSEYCRVINTRFKSGILLAQNSDQVPNDIPYLNIITPGHIGERKLWSDRGLYDLVINNKNKIFVDNFEFRNKLVQIIFDELFNSFNYS